MSASQRLHDLGELGSVYDRPGVGIVEEVVQLVGAVAEVDVLRCKKTRE